MAPRSNAASRPCVVITTYARPDSLSLLLDDLEREWPPDGLEVRIYDDATPYADPALENRIRSRGWAYRRAVVNHGKRTWWRWWNDILADLRGAQAQLFYVLQDDMRLCTRFFELSTELWTSIDDAHKASLYLHLTAERGRLATRCWGSPRAKRVGRVVHSGWIDLAAFLCDRRLFDGLAWRLEPVSSTRWYDKDAMSSGVGQQISVRARKLGLGLYRVERSLAVHDGGPSLLNAEARRRWPMETLGFVDGDDAANACLRPRPRISASLASIPSRERSLRHVVDALLPQVDTLGVYLNDYERVPRFLERDKVVVARSQESGGRGDAGKFFWAGQATGYQLVCDDDIAYPEDYVQKLVEGIEVHRRQAVVGFHGCVLGDDAVDYHRSRRLLHFTRRLVRDTAVHVLGTGVAGYHASTMAVRPEDFAAPNMADIWLGLLGQRQRVPFVCLRRDEGWLAELPGTRENSIYERAHRRRAGVAATPCRETLAVREHGRWELRDVPGARPRISVRPARARVVRPASVRPPEPAPSSRRALVRVRVTGPTRPGTLVLLARDHITSAVRHTGTYYERDLLDAIRERAAGGVFVDVGAHCGNHTAFFGLECAADLVVAIEPNPEAHAALLETVAENGLESRVTTRRLAVHPVWREVSLDVLPWRTRSGRANSGLVAIAAADATAPANGVPRVPAAPLDELLDCIDDVRLVKVDAVGHSATILASGRRTLLRDRPLVAAEASSPDEYTALRALLSAIGYRELGRYCWTPTWLWAPS